MYSKNYRVGIGKKFRYPGAEQVTTLINYTNVLLIDHLSSIFNFKKQITLLSFVITVVKEYTKSRVSKTGKSIHYDEFGDGVRLPDTIRCRLVCVINARE